MQHNSITQEEYEKAEAIAKTININDIDSINNFGIEPSKKLGVSSASILSNAKQYNIDKISSLLNNIFLYHKSYDVTTFTHTFKLDISTEEQIETLTSYLSYVKEELVNINTLHDNIVEYLNTTKINIEALRIKTNELNNVIEKTDNLVDILMCISNKINKTIKQYNIVDNTLANINIFIENCNDTIKHTNNIMILLFGITPNA